MKPPLSVAMDAVIRKFHKNGNSLLKLSKGELAILPHSFIEYFGQNDIHDVWDKLPDSFTSNPAMLKYRRCLKHYNLPTDENHIDGPAPMMKDCYRCNYV